MDLLHTKLPGAWPSGDILRETGYSIAKHCEPSTVAPHLETPTVATRAIYSWVCERSEFPASAPTDRPIAVPPISPTLVTRPWSPPARTCPSPPQPIPPRPHPPAPSAADRAHAQVEALAEIARSSLLVLLLLAAPTRAVDVFPVSVPPTPTSTGRATPCRPLPAAAAWACCRRSSRSRLRRGRLAH